MTTGSQDIYDFAAPIMIGTDRIGTVRVGLSLDRIYLVVRQVTLSIIVSIAIAMAIAGWSAQRLHKRSRGRYGFCTPRRRGHQGNLDIRAAQRIGENCGISCGAGRGMSCIWRYVPRCWYLVGTSVDHARKESTGARSKAAGNVMSIKERRR
jgi:hypothetical protein